MDKLEKLKSFKLYGVTSITAVTDIGTYLRKIRSAVESGLDMLQLRCKGLSDRKILNIGREVKSAVKEYDTLFIVNDRPDIALILEADGVHLGQDDIPAKDVKKMITSLKNSLIIGISTHSLEQALEARDNGADYIGVGPVFKTPTKADYIPVGLELVRNVSEKLPDIPFVAIGGINLGNLSDVVSAGAGSVAVVRALFEADDIAGVVRKFKEGLKL